MPNSATNNKIRSVEQISAGGVAFRDHNENLEIALILTINEHRWQLPKGHLDPGETAEQAALREVREEAGISCDLLEPIKTVNYWFTHRKDGNSLRIHKFVHFFVMKYVSGNVEDHDDEVVEAKWIEVKEALGLLFHDDEKEVVKKAAFIYRGLEL